MLSIHAVTDDELDKLITRLAVMDRHELRALLDSLKMRFPLDFTDEFLADISTDKLRHVTLAACLHADRAVTSCA